MGGEKVYFMVIELWMHMDVVLTIKIIHSAPGRGI